MGPRSNERGNSAETSPTGIKVASFNGAALK